MEPFDTIETPHGLCLPNHALFVGPTMSGKTRLVLTLLQRPECFNPPPEEVYFFYNEWQDLYEGLDDKLAKVGIKLHMRQGANLELDDIEREEKQRLYIIDDGQAETASSDEIAKITERVRHRNASLWLIWHMLYAKHPASRRISAMSFYYFFLPGPRLRSQIKTLDDQMRYNGRIVNAYEVAMAEHGQDFNYLFVNVAPFCPPKLRLKGQVHDPDHQYVYLA